MKPAVDSKAAEPDQSTLVPEHPEQPEDPALNVQPDLPEPSADETAIEPSRLNRQSQLTHQRLIAMMF